MLALRELQTEFGRALLGDDNASGRLLAALADDPFAEERLEIYRNNVLASLTAVLRDTFPVVCRLVDERFFAYAAREFIRVHPPSRPALSEYGAAFAGFLSDFPPCRDLIYLPDAVRLEWLMNVAATAPEREAVAAAALSGIAPEDAVQLRFQLNAFYLESPWPIDRIWRANQPDASDEAVDLDDGGVRLEISRRDGAIAFRSLGAGIFAFRSALATGAPLGAALEQALAMDADFAPGTALADLFNDGVVVAVMPSSPKKETAS